MQYASSPESHRILYDELVLKDELFLRDGLRNKRKEMLLKLAELSVLKNVMSEFLSHEFIETSFSCFLRFCLWSEWFFSNIACSSDKSDCFTNVIALDC